MKRHSPSRTRKSLSEYSARILLGRQRYKHRRETVEPRFGLIKHGLGIRRFLRRGLRAVEAECVLICTAVNLGILLGNWEQVRTGW